jgi:DHA1 family bicyclomycin/chloramphenicol resistance-like MFS transporter
VAPDSLARKPQFVITLGLLTGMAAMTVDLSLPAIPGMVRALATNLPRGQLIVGVFMAGLACGQIPAGLISDRVGRLPVLYAGMGLFAAGATAAAVATHIDVLLFARFVQGFGAASAIVLARAIVRDVASGREAAALMSVMTMIFTVMPVIAPSVGVALVAAFGWRGPFVTVAILGLIILAAMRRNLAETHRPDVDSHPLRQLASSFAEFFSHRQSVLALLLFIMPAAGFMSLIAVSSALVSEVYGFSIAAFGLLFALLGLSILLGSLVNRLLVGRFDSLGLIGLGSGLMGISGLQLLTIAWLDAAPFAWLWSSACLYLLAAALVLPNASVVALDPMPRIAGVASSILGTSQTLVGATGAIVGALIYDDTIRNSILLMGISGTATLSIFLLRPVIAPGPLVHHPEEPTRE